MKIFAGPLYEVWGAKRSKTTAAAQLGKTCEGQTLHAGSGTTDIPIEILQCHGEQKGSDLERLSRMVLSLTYVRTLAVGQDQMMVLAECDGR